MKCPYCDASTALVTGKAVYPHRPDLAGLKFHRCAPCDAYVGCHRAGAWVWVDGRKIVSDGTIPLGRLANANLRAAKQNAHRAFDPLWRSGQMSRRDAYSWLSSQLGISKDACHIGEFDEAGCAAVVLAVARGDFA